MSAKFKVIYKHIPNLYLKNYLVNNDRINSSLWLNIILIKKFIIRNEDFKCAFKRQYNLKKLIILILILIIDIFV